MAVDHGRLAEFYVANSGGTLENWHQYCDKINHPTTIDNPETTTFGKSAKTRIVGLEDNTISISGPRDVAIETLIYALKGNKRAYRYFAAGSASGKSYLAGTLLLASYEPASEVENRNEWSAELEADDTVTRTVI
jgi:hypothetical protein